MQTLFKNLVMVTLVFISILESGRASTEVASTAVITVASPMNFEQTQEAFKTAVAEKGLKLISEVDHAMAAQSVDQKLSRTKVFIIGNPKVGTQLMQEDQRVGLDLPLKVLIWENKEKGVQISYRSPKQLARDYELKKSAPILEKMDSALASIAEKLTVKADTRSK